MHAYDDLCHLLHEYKQHIDAPDYKAALETAMQIRSAASQLVVQAAMDSAPPTHVYQFKLDL